MLRILNNYILASFCETNLDLEPYIDEEYTEADDNKENDNTRKEVPEENESSGRRVSFQLDNLPSTPSGYLRKGRRLGKLLNVFPAVPHPFILLDVQTLYCLVAFPAFCDMN
jgi:hypothetical protein